MIKDMTSFAPAGVLGRGSAAVRPDAGSALPWASPAPMTARPGTGLPSVRRREPVAGVVGGVPVPCATSTHSVIQNGTTLGIHSSGRPLS